MNSVGLERRGFSKERIAKIHHAYKVLLASKLNTSQALEKLKAEGDLGGDVELLIRFVEASERGVFKYVCPVGGGQEQWAVPPTGAILGFRSKRCLCNRATVNSSPGKKP